MEERKKKVLLKTVKEIQNWGESVEEEEESRLRSPRNEEGKGRRSGGRKMRGLKGYL